MRKTFIFVAAVLFLSMMVGVSFAAEAVVEKEEVPSVVVSKKIVKTADNFIVMFDSSSSTKEPYKDTGMTTLEAEKKLLKDRNEILPDLGYNAGLYLYTPFKTVYMMQKYDRSKMAAAIDQLPTKSSGPTLLQEGLSKLEGVISGLSGRTVVFLFTQGFYSRMPGGRTPLEIAKRIAAKHNVCFYVVSTAKGDQEKAVQKAVATINECSRVIPFDQVFEKPVYLSGALFVIETKVEEYMTTIYRVADVKMDNILFDFNSDTVRPEYNDELNKLGTFLNNNSGAYVVLSGFADATGSAEYNLGLSRQRAESVEAYLVDKFNVSSDQIVTEWYGIASPVASNDTPAGRQQNRRVESIVMGLD